MTFHRSKASDVSHAEGSSTVTCADGLQITGCFVLDATGHARSLVEFDQKFDPGYQVRSFGSHQAAAGRCTQHAWLKR